MNLTTDPRFPLPNESTRQLTQRLYEVHKDIAIKVNGSAMWDGEGAAAPASGTWAQGDAVRNAAPVEAGSSGSKYVILGWICTASGTPGTWLSMRVLTGG